MVQLTFVGAERLATATQQSCTEVFVFHRASERDIVLPFQSIRPSAGLSARDVMLLYLNECTNVIS